ASNGIQIRIHIQISGTHYPTAIRALIAGTLDGVAIKQDTMAPIVQGKVSLTMPRHMKNINQPVRSKPQYFAARQGSRNMLEASERSTNSVCSLFVVEDAMLFAVSIVAAL